SVDRWRQRLEDLRDHMFGRHEVDVVATLVSKPQHHLRQPLRGNPLPAHLPGDVVVLAEHAAQVAAGEEDRARAIPPPQAVLLAEMREMRCNDSRPPDPTQAFDVMQPVDPAQPRADTASVGTEQNPGLHSPPRDLVDAEADIRGARSDAVHGSLSGSDPTRLPSGLVTRCGRACGAVRAGQLSHRHRAGRWRAWRWPHSVTTSLSRAATNGEHIMGTTRCRCAPRHPPEHGVPPDLIART